MINAEMPAKANTVQLTGTRYEKFSSHLLIAHHAMEWRLQMPTILKPGNLLIINGTKKKHWHPVLS